MRRCWPILLTLLVLAAVIAVLRLYVFALLVIPQEGQEPVLAHGDRVLVQRWVRHAERGDWVAFRSPAEPDTLPVFLRRLCAGCVLACPGDTVWMSSNGRVSACRDYGKGCIWPLIVPAEGQLVPLTSWNQQLYLSTVQRHEVQKAEISGGRFRIGGQAVKNYRFHRNYYWMMSGQDSNYFDSRTLGFVPAEHIEGRISTLLYSFDPSLPWYKCLRPSRLFKAVGGR